MATLQTLGILFPKGPHLLPGRGGSLPGLDILRVNCAVGNEPTSVGIKGRIVLEDVGRSWMCGFGCVRVCAHTVCKGEAWRRDEDRAAGLGLAVPHHSHEKL